MRGESSQRLCIAIMKEADPHRLMQLVIKLNSTLQERETELQRLHFESTQGVVTEPAKEAIEDERRLPWGSPSSRGFPDSYNQPLVRASRAASTRLEAPSLLIASER
jgi:hypothetical protein